MEWITTFEALNNIYGKEAYSNMAINDALKNHAGVNASFVRMFAKGVLRETFALDYIIDQLADKGVKSIKLRTLIVLRMGIYALRSLDSVPEYTAVDESVKLAKKVSKGSDKFVNALLRKYVRDEKNIKNSDELEVKYSCTRDLVELISEQFGGECEKILDALNTPAKTSIRTNILKTSREELIEMLKNEGIESVPDENTKSGIICDGGDLISSKSYKAGLFSVQGLSSLTAIEKFNPNPNSNVLDMCAAPGGKTFAMAEIMQNTGKIVACDIHPHKLDVMKAAGSRLGITNVKTELLDGTEYNSDFENSFDYVLADVPCSGLGVISSKPEIKLNYNKTETEQLIAIQKKILENAIKYTKNGGLIEYSTCTINMQENDAVINSIIKLQNSVQILENNLILPYNYTNGFFYCIMKKCLK